MTLYRVRYETEIEADRPIDAITQFMMELYDAVWSNRSGQREQVLNKVRYQAVKEQEDAPRDPAS